jgi:D-sedoheptulose 7-phosphate isomerase
VHDVMSAADAVLRKSRESQETQERFFSEHASRIADCARAMAGAFGRGARLFVMGNGGSSCDAQHATVEFMHPVVAKRPPLPAVTLAVEPALLSAVANDEDFSLAFGRQLRMLGRRGDIAQAAREMGLMTVGLSGRDGGTMSAFCDHLFIVPSFSIHRIQEAHGTLLHILWDLVHLSRGEEDVL